MKVKIVRIGNSRGIRLPKPLLAQAGLEEEVELQVLEGKLVLSSPRQPRRGWAEAAQALSSGGEDALLEDPVPTRFDLEEWEW